MPALPARGIELIQLTRLNNQHLTVNSDLIKFVEQAPDTVITLVTGEKIVVRDSVEEVLKRVIQFRRSVLERIVPTWDNNFAKSPPANCKKNRKKPEGELRGQGHFRRHSRRYRWNPGRFADRSSQWTGPNRRNCAK